jgi:hypothetical protein
MDVERYVVAIRTLGTTVEAEAKALAADLGATAYEKRLVLVAGFPAIVLATTDVDAAQALVEKLRARGHRALMCRVADVVRATKMIQMRHFQLDHDGLESGGERLPWADLSTIVRARHQRQVATTEIVKQKKFNATRAILTGGLIMRKTEQREVSTTTEEVEQVLYLFRASGGTPWILREQTTNYSALGAALTPIANRNFAIMIEKLRECAPHAVFDDSLIRRPTIDDVDLYAHLVASGTG